MRNQLGHDHSKSWKFVPGQIFFRLSDLIIISYFLYYSSSAVKSTDGFDYHNPIIIECNNAPPFLPGTVQSSGKNHYKSFIKNVLWINLMDLKQESKYLYNALLNYQWSSNHIVLTLF